jgi:hypothetical protein
MKKITLPHRTSAASGFMLLLTLLLSSSAFKGQTVLIPYAGTTSVPCGSNVLLQAHNGSTGTYNTNANGYCVLYAGGNAAINIAGTYSVESGWDFIRIYDGVGTSGTLLQTYTGLNLSMNFVGAPGQTLTVKFTSDASVNYNGFNLNVTYSGACFSVPCSGSPTSNTVTAPNILICPNSGPNALGLVNNYVSGTTPANSTVQTGFTYAWYTGTTSAVGPFPTLVPTATNQSYSAPGTSVTTWYQAVITCTNGGAFTTSATAGIVQIAGPTSSVVPYIEGFEGIGLPNKLPNCSWLTSGLGTTFQTYTSPASNNRVPRNGNNFGAFSAPSNNVAVYTNGIQMEPGITYSAAIHYATDYLGSSNWLNLKISIGPNQSPTGLVQVAGTSPAISGPYKRLDGTFTVPSSGIYYLAINATGLTGSAPYLMIDDISVTIPCDSQSGNSPTVTAVPNNTLVCQNDAIAVTANGAITYTWSDGSNGPVYSPTVLAVGVNTVMVAGTNTLTGCVASASFVLNVQPSPALSLFANNPASCSGQPVNISAFGNGSFNWSTSSQNSFITVNPTSTTIYSVMLTGSNGCTTSGTIQIQVLPLPTVGIQSGVNPDICAGEAVTLNGTGGTTYQWYWNVNTSQAPTLTDFPKVSTVYTLIAVGANGCSNKTTYNQNVSTCDGLSSFSTASEISLYPNPNSGRFEIATGSGAVNSILVTDLSGRVLIRQEGFSGKKEINMSDLSNGIYYVLISTDGGSKTYRVVKQ